MVRSVYFRVLGPITAEHDGRPIPIPGGRERCVLGALLLRPGQPVTIDRLAELVWAGFPPGNSRSAIQTYVSRLRSALIPSGTDGDQLIRRSGSGYLINIDPATVDSSQFDRLVKRARAATD